MDRDLSLPPDDLKPSPPQTRLTCVFRFAQQFDKKMRPCDAGYEIAVEPRRPFEDELLVGDIEQLIAFGDITSPVMFAVTNHGRSADQLLWIGPEGQRDCFCVLPGRTQPFFPAPGIRWYWRSAVDAVPVAIYAVA